MLADEEAIQENRLPSKSMIGQAIRDARKALKKRQGPFSESLGISQATLSAYEIGSVIPPNPRIEKIAAELNLDANNLLQLAATDRANRHLKGYSAVGLISEDQENAGSLTANSHQQDATAIKSYLHLMRERMDDAGSFSIELVAPEELPVVDNEMVQAEWAENLLTGCTYRIHWFTDFLLANLGKDMEDAYAALESFVTALKSVNRQLQQQAEQAGSRSEADFGKVEHLFMWSGSCQLDLSKPQLEKCSTRMVQFVRKLTKVEGNCVFIEGEGEIKREVKGEIAEGGKKELPAKKMFDHIDNFLTIKRDGKIVRLREIEEQFGQFSDVQVTAGYITGDFWSNGDSVFVFRFEDRYSEYDPIGCRRVRTGPDMFSPDELEKLENINEAPNGLSHKIGGTTLRRLDRDRASTLSRLLETLNDAIKGDKLQARLFDQLKNKSPDEDASSSSATRQDANSNSDVTIPEPKIKARQTEDA